MDTFIPITAIANTPLPLGYEPEDLLLRRFILNAQQSVSANNVKRHRMLKDALHAHVQTAFGEAIDSLVAIAADELYTRLTAKGCAVPDEFEADEPDGSLPLDLPGEETE